MKIKILLTIIVCIAYTKITKAQIPTNGLIGFYPFNQQAIDASGHQNNGIIYGATPTPDKNGVENSAYSFNGTDNYIDFGINSKLNPQSALTISCFVKKNISTTYQTIVRNRYNGFGLKIDPYNGIGLELYLSKNNVVTYYPTYTNTNSIDGNWHHIAAVWDGTTAKIYLDGGLIKQSSASGDFISYIGNSVAIGRDANGAVQYFSGTIDNVRIYSVALDASQVNQLYMKDNYQVLVQTDTIVKIDTAYRGIPYKFLPLPLSGFRYIKYESFYSQDNGQVNVYEIQAYKQGVNIALNKPSYANSCNGDLPKNAVDNNEYSRWSSNRSDVGPDFSNPHYIIIDLGQKLKIDSMLLNIKGFDSWNQTFSFLASPDSINWYLIGSGNDTTGIFKYHTDIEKIVTVKDTVLVSVKDTLIIDAVLTGINPPHNLNAIKIYPNPARDHITINYGNYSIMNGYNLKITNSGGQQMFITPINQQESFLNLSDWSGNGIYFVYIIDNKNNIIETRKIVLQ